MQRVIEMILNLTNEAQLSACVYAKYHFNFTHSGIISVELLASKTALSLKAMLVLHAGRKR